MKKLLLKTLPLGAKFKHDFEGHVLSTVINKNPFQFQSEVEGKEEKIIFTAGEHELNFPVYVLELPGIKK